MNNTQVKNIYQQIFNGKTNFFTPTIKEYGVINNTTLYELSAGSVNYGNDKIYGVTIVSNNNDSHTWQPDALSTMRETEQDARDYITQLKENIMQLKIHVPTDATANIIVSAESNSGLAIHKTVNKIIDNQPVFSKNRWNVTHKKTGCSIANNLHTRQQARQFAKDFTSLIPLDLFSESLAYNDNNHEYFINDRAVKVIGANIVKRFKP